MATILQGQRLPAGTSTSTSRSTQSSSTQFAPFAQDFLSKLSAGALGQMPSGQQLIAPQSALTTAAYGAAPGALTAYQDPMAKGVAAAGDVAGGVTSGDISQFYNPYEQRVVDEMGRQSAMNVQRNLLPQIKAGFVGSGGLGAQRYAGALGQTMSDVQADLLGKQSAYRAAGYGQAVDAALKSAGLQNQAAQVLGTLGTAEQNAAVQRLNTLAGLGGQEQAYEQAQIEAPLTRMQNIAQIMRGMPMQTSSATGTSAADTVSNQYTYGPSPLSQLGTLLTTGSTVASTLAKLLGLSGGSDDALQKALEDWAKTPDYEYPNIPYPPNPYNDPSEDT